MCVCVCVDGRKMLSNNCVKHGSCDSDEQYLK